MMDATAAPCRIRKLSIADAHAFDSLRVAYGTELGGRPAPDMAFAQAVLKTPYAHVWGAVMHGDVVGFALVFALPEAVFGTMCGVLDDLFVTPAARGQGVARALLAEAAAHGEAAGWSHLRWLVPEGDDAAIRLYDRIARRAPWRSYVIRLREDSSL
jgi:GNAT superfamily N-acetyltransferase